jgi:hypothetical protein
MDLMRRNALLRDFEIRGSSMLLSDFAKEAEDVVNAHLQFNLGAGIAARDQPLVMFHLFQEFLLQIFWLINFIRKNGNYISKS